MLETNIDLSTRKFSGAFDAPTNYGRVHYRPGGTFGPRRMTQFQLVFLEEGSALYEADGHVLSLGPGDVVVCRPGTVDRFAFDENRTSIHSWCGIDPDALEPELATWLERDERVTRRTSMRMLWLVDTALGLPPGAFQQGQHRHLANVLFAEFLRLGSTAPQQNGNRDERSPVLHPSVARVIQAIESRFAEPLTLEDLADVAGLTAQHLRKIFKAATRKSPVDYLWETRLEHARRLITGTGLTLSEISAECGFTNPYHFSRKFREAYGEPPREYRKRVWEGG